MKLRTVAFSLCLCILASGMAAAASPDIYLTSKADALEQQAALELQRYLYAVQHNLSAIKRVERVSPSGSGFVLGTPETLPELTLSYPFGLDIPSGDGYILRSISEGRRSLVVIAAPTGKGVLNGVFGLLEELGYGFYLGGDTLPESCPTLGEIAQRGLSVSKTPSFSVRGSLPWFNFLNSPTTWELADYQAFIDQLTRMRCNFIGFHAYDNEPFTAFQSGDKLLGGEPLQNTSDSVWGTKPMRTSEFFAGTGEYFASDYFGAGASMVEDRAQAIQAAKDTLRGALNYAKARGLTTCLGFEVSGNPLAANVQARFEERLKQLLADYPMLDYVWLWEAEGLGMDPGKEPAPRTPLKAFASNWAETFSDVTGTDRQAEAARLTLFGMHAYQVLKATRPDVRLAMSGWGGDNWLHCSDFFPGMDKLLPPDVAFSALDNIEVTPTVSEAYGQLSAQRQRWPIIWYEFDGDQWVPHANLDKVAGACQDALKKGAQGLIGIHWRTRDVEESATFCARFAWDTTLTTSQFLARRAQDLFGHDKAAAIEPYLQRLQNLGYRWVGGAGQTECGSFTWPTADEAKRAELAVIGYELRRLAGKGTSLTTEAARELTKVEAGLVPMEKGPLGLFLSATFNLDKPAPIPLYSPLEDLIAQIDYVLAWTHATDALRVGSQLDELVEQERPAEAAALVEASRLSEAMHLFASRMRTKGELGVLATINAKAWANIRERGKFDEATLTRLQALPKDYQDHPQLLVLPDRVIVAGAGDKNTHVTIKARPLGAKRFAEAELPRLGGSTYGRLLPSSITGGAYEYGIEVKAAHGVRLMWPAGFPDVIATGLQITAQDSAAPAAPAPEVVAPAKIETALLPELWRMRLTWDVTPGQTYTVVRKTTPLATVATGWFEDTSPPSNALVEYEVVARSIITGQTAGTKVAVMIPELPLPAPPKDVRVTTRANRIIVGWKDESPNAAQYYILKYDRNYKLIEEMFVDSDFGHYIQISDHVEPGEPYTYTVSAVAPDGRAGAPSQKFGIVSSTEPLRPLLRLSFKDEQFLAGLAQLSERGIALGGRGWAELPAQPEWDPGHAISLSAWVKMDDLQGMPVLVCKGSWQKAGYFLQLVNGKVRFYLAGVDTLDAGQLKQGEWQHIVATFGFNEMRVYINGQLADRKHVTGRPRGSDNAPLLIGRYGANEEVYFVRGQMDDIRIYDVPLTTVEIKSLFEETQAHG